MDITKILKDCFEAGENYVNGGEFAFYAPSFDEWYKSIEPELTSKLKEETDGLIRFVIRQWASLNEQNEPDHKALVDNFLETTVLEYLKEVENKD